MGLDSYLFKNSKTNMQKVKKYESDLDKINNLIDSYVNRIISCNEDSEGKFRTYMIDVLNGVSYVSNIEAFKNSVGEKLFVEGVKLVCKKYKLYRMNEKASPKTIGYWRKNWKLHEIITRYNKNDEDNCTNIYLNLKQLNEILSCVDSPYYEGDDREYTKKVIKSAIKYLEGDKKNERKVFFYSWY